MDTLLIVEDEKMIRQGIKAMAMRSGVPIARILDCSDGAQALEILRHEAVDGMITDIRMPHIDGIGLVQAMQTLPHMLKVVEAGKAAAVFVKDMSRLGRNYIEVGRLTEGFFPEHNTRLVAVSDNIDTDEGENELTPIRNLFNEWYARDISKKRRISNKIKGAAGEPLGQPPYGYVKDAEKSANEEPTRERRIYSPVC